jgi:hypothetical protein
MAAAAAAVGQLIKIAEAFNSRIVGRQRLRISTLSSSRILSSRKTVGSSRLRNLKLTFNDGPKPY